MSGRRFHEHGPTSRTLVSARARRAAAKKRGLLGVCAACGGPASGVGDGLCEHCQPLPLFNRPNGTNAAANPPKKTAAKKASRGKPKAGRKPPHPDWERWKKEHEIARQAFSEAEERFRAGTCTDEERQRLSTRMKRLEPEARLGRVHFPVPIVRCALCATILGPTVAGFGSDAAKAATAGAFGRDPNIAPLLLAADYDARKALESLPDVDVSSVRRTRANLLRVIHNAPWHEVTDEELVTLEAGAQPVRPRVEPRTPPPPSSDVAGYYRAAMRALRFIDRRAPRPRRFGPEVDAKWDLLGGDLELVDRIELLVRDADAEFGEAFGDRIAFGFMRAEQTLASGTKNAYGIRTYAGRDSVFVLSDVDGHLLWHEAIAVPPATDVRSAIEQIASAWDLTLAPFDVPDPHGPERFVVAGPSAVAALAARFEGRDGLSWSTQVTVIATPPGHRQIAALASALLGMLRPARVLAHDDPSAKQAFGRGVVSPDADEADAAVARARLLACGASGGGRPWVR